MKKQGIWRIRCNAELQDLIRERHIVKYFESQIFEVKMNTWRDGGGWLDDVLKDLIKTGVPDMIGDILRHDLAVEAKAHQEAVEPSGEESNHLLLTVTNTQE